MTEDTPEELREVSQDRVAQDNLTCMARYLNSIVANNLASEFAHVFAEELTKKQDPSEPVCVVHVLHAAILILLDNVYKMRGLNRQQWIEEYAQLMALVNSETQAILRQKQEELDAKKDTIRTEAN